MYLERVPGIPWYQLSSTLWLPAITLFPLLLILVLNSTGIIHIWWASNIHITISESVIKLNNLYRCWREHRRYPKEYCSYKKGLQELNQPFSIKWIVEEFSPTQKCHLELFSLMRRGVLNQCCDPRFKQEYIISKSYCPIRLHHFYWSIPCMGISTYMAIFYN